MLSMDHVRKNYSDFALDCSLEVPDGCITGLIGANGAGKSTAFKAILGLIRTEGGEIRLQGKKPETFDAQDRERIGVVLADSGFSNYMRIGDIIPVLRQLYHRFDETYFRERCQKFHLPLDKKLKEFSTGMKRKVQILAALSHDADFLLLDEPTAGLDVMARDEIQDLLREYMAGKEGRSILISSHISSDLEELCDDIYLIHEGRILLHEDTDVLISEYGILKVTEEQYQKLDPSYLLSTHKERYGYSCLTAQRAFYQENYPQIEIERGSLDEIIRKIEGGEA